MSDPIRPHIFVSYAWEGAHNPGHDEKVLRLATQLAEKCHVELDKWSLQPGESVHAFMERMVNDARIGKVVVLCDRTYTEKARSGKGGVGTETTIMSPEVYEQMKQRHRQEDAPPIKFIPVVFERGDAGEAYLPTMFASAKYIDLSSEDLYLQNFEELERAIWDRPALEQPIPRDRPAFLSQPDTSTPNASSQARAVYAQLEQANPIRAEDSLRRYFEAVVEHWSTLKSVTLGRGNTDVPFFLSELGRFEGLRGELQSLAQRLAGQRTLDDPALERTLESFFEGAVQARQSWLEDSQPQNTRADWTASHFDLLIYETYLLFLAAFLSSKRWQVARFLAQLQVFVRTKFNKSQDRALTFLAPSGQMLEQVETHLNQRFYSPGGHLLSERNDERTFERMCEAECILLTRDILNQGSIRFNAVTLPYWGRRSFELFGRTSRPEIATGLALVLGDQEWVSVVGTLKKWLESKENFRQSLSFEHHIDLNEVWNLPR